MSCRLRPASALLLLAIAGCGSAASSARPEIEKVVPVSGTVTYRGTPLEHFQVIFVPEDGRRAAVGMTDAEGRFTLGTNDVADGAPPGMHKVAVAFAGPPSTDNSATETPIDDPALLPQPKVKVPLHYGDPERSGLKQEVPTSGLTDLKIDLE